MDAHVAVVYSPEYLVDLWGLQRLHSFDVNKYRRIRLRLEQDGLLGETDIHRPAEATRDDLLLVHTPGHLERLKESHNVGQYLEVPLMAALPARVVDARVLKPFRFATGGTILAGRLALRHGLAVNIGGGFHHAKPDLGEGFNVYADISIAVRRLRSERLIGRAAVVDLDVHQGNGTATVFAADPAVFTFSMHEGDIFPIPKARSSLDVELPPGADDATCLGLLRRHLPAVLDASRPDIVFFQAGCDTLAGDPLANLAMSREGIVERDATVIDECVRRRIPLAMTLGGGYARDSWLVQFASIRRTIQTYGLARPTPQPG